MSIHKFRVGETVECWTKLNNRSRWSIGTIVAANVDDRNRRAYRYTVDWEDNSGRSTDIQGKLIRKLTINFAPNPIEPSNEQHSIEDSTAVHSVTDTGCRVPLIPEEELTAITDVNINTEMQKLIDDGRSIIAQSIDTTVSDDIKRILQSPVTSNSAKKLWTKERVDTLKKVLAFRGASTDGLKPDLFQRAHPMHAKVLPPPKKKSKTAAQKKEEQQWKNTCKRNAKTMKTLFTDWVKRQKNEVSISIMHT